MIIALMIAMMIAIVIMHDCDCDGVCNRDRDDDFDVLVMVIARGVACGGVTPPPPHTHTLFTELVGKMRSRSVMAEAVGKTDRLN